ncbi:MerR family transcriptional regulator [Temperatibacter marinus]|uniref:MerR family transcriptional regulator n=1 Tax=Temperatibacter marinus TaxID=1456591 RepID=A0AA52EFU7_9PROT|nr:MerR family transcriptional regulator [Temperatibacter marinus]WND04006.1 MerR family transcriptional regulator [Temperatibacter marinus]
MYQISDLATAVGLSRTALLYYEKIGLLSSARLDNGYRVYGEKEVQRVRLLQQLQAGGLTLKECKLCLDAKIDKDLLEKRLKLLDEEIEHKQRSRSLLAALLGQGDLSAWHESLDQVAPDAHLDWLMKQGFSEKEALQLKWLSKDMNEHDAYMKDFMMVYGPLERWAPGSEADTSMALSKVRPAPKAILEIGCGKGLSTTVLAAESQAEITAVDNEQEALNALKARMEKFGYGHRLKTLCASMTELPVDQHAYDLIWSEGSAYIMGVEKALSVWKPFLKDQGYLMLSDLVWKTASPSEPTVEFWQKDYPDIQQIETRLHQIEKAGFHCIDHFPQSHDAWLNYYAPLQKRLTDLAPDMPNSVALKDIQLEVRLCMKYESEFGYHMFLLQKTA